MTWHDRHFRVHDTAGLRRRARIEEKLEKLSVADALNAVRFAEVVILLMDAERPFEEQDLRIADLIEREGRALVIAMSKWDLVERRAGAIKTLRADADHCLPQVKGVPVVAVSGLTGEGLDRLMQAVVDVHAVWNRRIGTSALNRWLAEVVAVHPPPAVSGRRIRLDYVTQPKSRPPSFVLFTSRSDAVPDAYRRYLVNSLRESFDLPGTPIRLTLREKKNPYAPESALIARSERTGRDESEVFRTAAGNPETSPWDRRRACRSPARSAGTARRSCSATFSGVSSVIGSSPGIACARMRVRIGPGVNRLTRTLRGRRFRRIGARQRFERGLGDRIGAPIGQRPRRHSRGDEHHASGVGELAAAGPWRG